MFLDESSFNWFTNQRDEQQAEARGIISRYGSIEAWPVPVDFQDDAMGADGPVKVRVTYAGCGLLAGNGPVRKGYIAGRAKRRATSSASTPPAPETKPP